MSKKIKTEQELENEKLEQRLAKHYTDIDKVIINAPTVIVILKNGGKGVSTPSHGDVYNYETGFWCAYAKALRSQIKTNSKNAFPFMFKQYPGLSISNCTIIGNPAITDKS